MDTADRDALGRQSVFTEIFSWCWRGKPAHANTMRIIAKSLAQVVAGVKAPALPYTSSPTAWAGAIFIIGNHQPIPPN